MARSRVSVPVSRSKNPAGIQTLLQASVMSANSRHTGSGTANISGCEPRRTVSPRLLQDHFRSAARRIVDAIRKFRHVFPQ
jgi:hypothetical protein